MSARILSAPSSGNRLERDTLEDIDEFEDTQPSVVVPGEDEDFSDEPTLPGFHLRADGSVLLDGAATGVTLNEGQWERALRAVAVAVKRVFASHAIS